MKVLRIHTLKKGWCDKDEVMLHAVFQLLVDFMEKEEADKIVAWNADSVLKNAWKEICWLYHWWTQARPARKSPLDERGLTKPPTHGRR